ncbi:hypothetical protein ES703_73613 [subsurface metagenome]
MRVAEVHPGRILAAGIGRVALLRLDPCRRFRFGFAVYSVISVERALDRNIIGGGRGRLLSGRDCWNAKCECESRGGRDRIGR